MKSKKDKLTKEEEKEVRYIKRTKRLFKQFGYVPFAYYPGVRCFMEGHGNKYIDFDDNTWDFVEPLLKELVKYRNKYGTNTNKRKACKETRNVS